MNIIEAIIGGRVEPWFHKEQGKEPMGYEIFRFMVANPSIGSKCVRGPEIRAIHAKGPEFIQKYLPNETIFGLSINPDFSPFITVRNGIVVWGWQWNGYRREKCQPVLCYKEM